MADSTKCYNKGSKRRKKNLIRQIRSWTSLRWHFRKRRTSIRRSWMTVRLGTRTCAQNMISKFVIWEINWTWKPKIIRIREKKSRIWSRDLSRNRMSSNLCGSNILWFNRNMKNALMIMIIIKLVIWNRYQCKMKIPLKNFRKNKTD